MKFKKQGSGARAMNKGHAYEIRAHEIVDAEGEPDLDYEILRDGNSRLSTFHTLEAAQEAAEGLAKHDHPRVPVKVKP